MGTPNQNNPILQQWQASPVSAIIRPAREALALQMETASRKLHIRRSELSRIERGLSMPSVDQSKRIAALYGLDQHWLAEAVRMRQAYEQHYLAQRTAAIRAARAATAAANAQRRANGSNGASVPAPVIARSFYTPQQLPTVGIVPTMDVVVDSRDTMPAPMLNDDRGQELATLQQLVESELGDTTVRDREALTKLLITVFSFFDLPLKSFRSAFEVALRRAMKAKQ